MDGEYLRCHVLLLWLGSVLVSLRSRGGMNRARLRQGSPLGVMAALGVSRLQREQSAAGRKHGNSGAATLVVSLRWRDDRGGAAVRGVLGSDPRLSVCASSGRAARPRTLCRPRSCTRIVRSSGGSCRRRNTSGCTRSHAMCVAGNGERASVVIACTAPSSWTSPRVLRASKPRTRISSPGCRRRSHRFPKTSSARSSCGSGTASPRARSQRSSE